MMQQSAVHHGSGSRSSSPDLLARRQATLGPYSPLFYDSPVELVSGSGVWLTDVDGVVYLDGYNNVPHVGHANPVVTEAISAQLRQLNLHTRYLNSRVVDYAETLLGTFGGGLDRLFLTNSGSEANDLALRIARQHSGNTGVLVSDWAYHGNTTSIAEITTGLLVREPLADYARAIRVPDAIHLSDTEQRTLCDQALADIDTAIRSLIDAGHGVSALLYDPLFSTEGLIRPPAGFMEGLAQRVRAAGGLLIADEVQSGFGRVGGIMWGHLMYDVTPDLVTLGKPMGNGQPLGGVVTTRGLLEEFGSRNDYFNTFAGNPVSSAAGLAVLQVMEQEGLLDKAATLGSHVAARLAEMVASNPRVNAVRGRGLYFGLEFVRPDGDRAPDAAFTKQVIEDMRQRRVLINRIGRHDNVLKIRPPMVVSVSEIDLLLDQLEASLHGLETR